MKQSSRSPLGFYTMGIAALFLVGSLLLVMFGAQTYRDAAAGQAENNKDRALLSYISISVKGNDTAGNITVEEREGGPVLVIGDEAGYALYIYQKDGQLLEEYHAKGASFSPDTANVLGETEIFTIEMPTENTLKITTDVGSTLLHLRSGEAAK